MSNEPVKVNRQVLEVMNMNRKARRAIARQKGLKNIPSITNVMVTKVEQPEKQEDVKTEI